MWILFRYPFIFYRNLPISGESSCYRVTGGETKNILSSVNLNIYSIAAVIDSIVTRFTIGLLWLKIIKQSSFFCKEKRRKQHFIAHTIYRAYIRTATVQRHHQPTKYLLIPSSDNKGCCGSFCPSPIYRVYTHTTYLPAVFLNVKRHHRSILTLKQLLSSLNTIKRFLRLI